MGLWNVGWRTALSCAVYHGCGAAGKCLNHYLRGGTRSDLNWNISMLLTYGLLVLLAVAAAEASQVLRRRVRSGTQALVVSGLYLLGMSWLCGLWDGHTVHPLRAVHVAVSGVAALCTPWLGLRLHRCWHARRAVIHPGAPPR